MLGWHYGFAAAGAGMTVALIVYLYAMPTLPPDEMHKAKASGLDKKPLDRNEWRAVLALIVLFLPTTLFWATYERRCAERSRRPLRRWHSAASESPSPI
jgi:POT family proton-dependent oligopeptide transporter